MPKSKPSSFEEAFDELDKTVQQLEAGDIPLEESISLFERGMKLASELEKQLEQAELRVRKLRPSAAELEAADELGDDGADAKLSPARTPRRTDEDAGDEEIE